MPVHGSVVPLSSGWQKRMYHWIMQPATSAIPRTHVTHQLRRSSRSLARSLFSFFFFLRRIAHRERSAFTRRAQYLEDRVLLSLPSFAPFHPSSLHLRSLPSGRVGRWPDLVKHIRGSLRGLWTVRSVQMRGFYRDSFTMERGGERPDENMKAWRAKEKESEKERRAYSHAKGVIYALDCLPLSFPIRIVFLLFFRYVRSRNVVYSHRGRISLPLSPLNTFFPSLPFRSLRLASPFWKHRSFAPYTLGI